MTTRIPQNRQTPDHAWERSATYGCHDPERVKAPWILIVVMGSLALIGCIGNAKRNEDRSALEPFLNESPSANLAQVSGQQTVAIDPAVAFQEPTSMVALVGDQPIYAGDLLPTIEQVLEPYQGKAPADQLEQQKLLLAKQLLKNKVDTSLLLLDFYRKVPASELEARLNAIHERIEDQFFKEQMPKLLEKAQVKSAAELERKLQTYGSSVENEKRQFAEQIISRSVVGQRVNRNPTISYDELLDAYNERLDEYRYPARARWEKLSVLFDKTPDRNQAYQMIAAMGNEVLHGAPLDAVAQRSSQGVNAANGGYYDWTTQASLVSEVLDQAIFTLPVMRLSPILEDQRGFHIVRVVERTDAGVIPFTEAQEGIRKDLIDAKVKEQVDTYVAELRKQTPVWTIFDRPDEVRHAAAPVVVPRR